MLCSLFVASVEEVRAVARRRRVVVPLGVIVVKISSLEIGRVIFSRAVSVTATAATTITARAEVEGEGGERQGLNATGIKEEITITKQKIKVTSEQEVKVKIKVPTKETSQSNSKIQCLRSQDVSKVPTQHSHGPEETLQ